MAESATSMSYALGPMDKPLIEKSIGELFDENASRFADNEALVSRHQGLRFTYQQLSAKVDELAIALLGFGIKKGNRVGIWSPNNAEWVLTQFATAKVGAILVNINPAYRVSELEYALNQSGVSLLITAKQFKTSDYHWMISQLAPEIRNFPKIGSEEIRAARVPALRRIVTLADEHDQTSTSMIPWQKFLEVGSMNASMADLREREGSLRFEDPINIQYTSGTTGFPKGATLTHLGILNNGYFAGEEMNFTSRDRLCIPVPFYHCFGMVLGNLACVTHGATMILPGDSFGAETVLQTVEEENCSALHGVPTMFIAELEDPTFKQHNLATLRTGIMAGSPCPVEVMKRVISDMGMNEITICYGMTETSPVSFQTRINDPLELRVSTVGCAHPHVEAKVVDPLLGGTLPFGNAGELCVRGYLVMLKYWNNAEATKEAIDSDGWMHTGDLAVMSENSYVNIVGRTKDMISRGGEKIFPREVEDFLYTHPKISEVQVIGVPSRKYGEEVMAWVKVKPGETATEEELREFCRKNIAYFKVPTYFKFTDEFPMTVTGKIQKFKMREISTRELGLESVASIKTA
ncbi:MAG TPA: AMP-binding protein [Candidatus Acidoferrales bacterium]|nr:AMP-binding protein [Candidatus Acidoferrales bacterium]